MSRPADDSSHAALVHAWAEHLRGGGTTPWLTYAPAAPVGATGAEEPLPGAAQLEVVRRLAARRTPAASGSPTAADPDRFAALAGRVLAATGPGRGLPHLPVRPHDPGSDAAAPRVGARPVDPARVPAEELVRVLTGVLPGLLVDAPVLPAPAAGEPTPRPSGAGRLRRLLPGGRSARPVAGRFALMGPPAAVAAIRADLLAAGCREGGRGAVPLVLGLPLETMLTEAWAGRVRRGSATRWIRFTSKWSERPPVSADLPALARHRARTAGAVGEPGPVLVLGADHPALRAGVASALGLPDLPPASSPPAQLDAAGADLVRRLNRVAPLAVGAAAPAVTAATVARLARPGAAPALRAPEQLASRIATLGARLIEEVVGAAERGDYAVVGDPGVLGPVGGTRAAQPDVEVVLERALDLALTLSAETTES